MTTLKTLHILPGDVIRHRGDVMTVHHIWQYNDGSASLRARFTSNPRGVDWRVFVAADEDVILVARGVALLDPFVRSLLP